MRARLSLFAAALLLVTAAACGHHDAPAPTPRPPAPPPRQHESPTTHDPNEGVAALPHPEPIDDLHDIDDTPEPGDVQGGHGDVASPELLDSLAPAHACVAITRAPVRVWPRGGPADVLAVPLGFVVAGYAPGEHGGEEVFVMLVSPGHAQSPVARFTLANAANDGARDAPPALAARDDGHVLLAVADGHGTLRAATLGLLAAQAAPPLVVLGEGADLRFQPALVVTDGVPSVAYTDGRNTPMRVRIATLADDLHAVDTRDVTPEAMGASTPFALGGDVVFLDAHGGLSPVIRVPLDAHGAPGEAVVERPLSTVSQPAHIAAASVAGTRYVAYTAIGNAATSAVGLVALGDVAPPRAIVPGTGYGKLHLDAVDATQSAIFAADHPVTGAGADEELKTDIAVRVLDAAGLGTTLTIAEPSSHRAGFPALARGHDGTVAVAYTAPTGVYVEFLRCAD